MKTLLRKYTGLFIFFGLISLLISGCFKSIDSTTEVTGFVKDTTGKPMPGFVFLLIGDDGKLNPTNEYRVTTDQIGAFRQTIHWGNNTVGYHFNSILPQKDSKWYGLSKCTQLYSCEISPSYPQVRQLDISYTVVPLP